MIFIQMKEQFNQMIDLVQKLTPDQITQKVALLGEVSIGQHTRHIIELWQCALKGYDSGVVDYHNRERNLLLELDRDLILKTLSSLPKDVFREDKELALFTSEDVVGKLETVPTTYYREVVYNIEHMIHHMALIKVALRAMGLEITASNFGMAYATLRYQAG